MKTGLATLLLALILTSAVYAAEAGGADTGSITRSTSVSVDILLMVLTIGGSVVLSYVTIKTSLAHLAGEIATMKNEMANIREAVKTGQYNLGEKIEDMKESQEKFEGRIEKTVNQLSQAVINNLNRGHS